MPILAIGAIAAGVGVATGVVAVSTVAMIGLGATVVGKITKSKELMQLGAGLSLGAGVAGLAESLFSGASAGVSAGAGTTEAATAGIGPAAESVSGIDTAAGLTGAGEGVADAIRGAGLAASDTTGLLGASNGLDSLTTANIGLPSSTGVSSGLLNSGATPSQPLTATPMVPNVGSEIANLKPTTDLANYNVTGGLGSLTPPAGTDSSSISKWWNSLKEGDKNRVLQVGGNAIGGMFEGWSAEQKLALERERLNLEKQRQATSQSNANAQPKVAFQNVAPPTGGLLYSAKRG